MAKKKFKDVNLSVEEKLRKALKDHDLDANGIELLLRQKIEEDKLYAEILFALNFVDFTKHLYNEAGDVSYYELIRAKMRYNKEKKIGAVLVKYR